MGKPKPLNQVQMRPHHKYNIMLRKLVGYQQLYTQFPEILTQLKKEQVVDIIDNAIRLIVEKGWFSIAPTVTYENFTVGFDRLFLNTLMGGYCKKDKDGFNKGEIFTWTNTYQAKHTLVKLFQQYFELYDLTEWYVNRRPYWYDNLPHTTSFHASLENFFVIALDELFDFPLYLKEPFVWTKNPEDFLLNGMIAWFAGTHDLSSYSDVNLFIPSAISCTQNLIDYRTEWLNTNLNMLKERDLWISWNTEQLFTTPPKRKERAKETKPRKPYKKRTYTKPYKKRNKNNL